MKNEDNGIMQRFCCWAELVASEGWPVDTSNAAVTYSHPVPDEAEDSFHRCGWPNRSVLFFHCAGAPQTFCWKAHVPAEDGGMSLYDQYMNPSKKTETRSTTNNDLFSDATDPLFVDETGGKSTNDFFVAGEQKPSQGRKKRSFCLKTYEPAADGGLSEYDKYMKNGNTM